MHAWNAGNRVRVDYRRRTRGAPARRVRPGMPLVLVRLPPLVLVLLVLVHTVTAYSAKAEALPRASATFNWSYFPHFTWRARVTSISDGRPIPNNTWFSLAGNATSANGSAWSLPMSFDNVSIKQAMGAYTNKELLGGKGSYDALAGDSFDLLNFKLSAGDVRTQQSTWGHWNDTVEVGLDLEVTFMDDGVTTVHHATSWRGGVCTNDCECSVGLLLGRNTAGDPELSTFREYNQRKYFTHFQLLPNLTRFPKKIMLMDSFCSDTEPGSWRDGIHNLRKLGLRAMRLCPGNPVSVAIESEIRMIKKNVTGEQLTDGGAFGPTRSRGNDWAAKDSAFALYAHNRTARILEEARQVAAYTAAGYDRTDVTLANMADEPYLGGGLGGGLGPLPPVGNASFAGAAATQQWLKYLRDPAKGLTPAVFGVSSWQNVMPSGRPTSPSPSRAERARYYWTLRFMAWFPTLDYAEGTKMSREAFSEAIYTYANTNNFGSRFFYPGRFDNESLLAFDWFELGRNNATSLLWTEDWIGSGVAWQLSYYASIFRAGQRAARGSTHYGMYIVPRAATGWPPGGGGVRHMEDGLFRKIMNFIGQGAKAIEYFCFGPEYLFPDIAKSMNKAHGMIAHAEDLLFPGQRPAAQIGILFPRSSFVWDTVSVPGELQNLENLTEHAADYAAEVLGEYIMLAIHANMQVDMLDEDMVLDPEMLEPLRLLIITEPNVPDSAMRAVSQWVTQGGTLLTTSGAATYDRLNDTSTVLQALTKIVEHPRPRLNVNYATDANYCCCPPCTGDRSFPVVASGTIAWPGSCAAAALHCQDGSDTVRGTFGAVGIRSNSETTQFTGDDERTHMYNPDHLSTVKAETLGTFTDGSDAIVRTAVGKGSAIHFNFLPGLSYMPNATNWGRLALPSEFPATLRHTLVAAARDAGVQPVVRCSEAFVETPLLLSPQGAVLTLLNWGDKVFSTAEPIELNITLPFEPHRVVSVENGPSTVDFRVLNRDDGDVVITTQLGLGAADFLLMWRAEHSAK